MIGGLVAAGAVIVILALIILFLLRCRRKRGPDERELAEQVDERRSMDPHKKGTSCSGTTFY